MPAFGVQDIVNAIKTIYPGEKIEVSEHGKEQGSESKRYLVTIHVFGATVELAMGSNLVLHINGAPRETLMYLVLLHPDYARREVEKWLKRLKPYLEAKDVPQIKLLARQYLGKEERVEKKPNAVWVVYDKFVAVVTPDSAALLLRDTRRVVQWKKFANNEELEEFFKVAYYSAAQIRQGY